MSRPRLPLLATEAPDGGVELRCPGPGRVRWQRPPGEVLVAGSVVGTLVRDERAFELVVPPGIRGAVVSVGVPHLWNACAHGDLLAALAESAALDAAADSASPAGSGPAVGASRLFEVRSPTHGTFYTRPSPTSPPYVSPGATVESGQTIGLVEVMKCFSPILFEGPAGGHGVLHEVLVSDGSEVRADQTLMRIELG